MDIRRSTSTKIDALAHLFAGAGSVLCLFGGRRTAATAAHVPDDAAAFASDCDALYRDSLVALEGLPDVGGRGRGAYRC